MYFLNLSLFQFIAIFGSISAISVALYLLDRSRRKQVVSTLRFWVAAENPVAAARRKHITQPWSLFLQLAGMALLLLAIAQLRLGAPAQAGRDHVVILETSAWMGARTGGNRTLMDTARARARSYVHALPARDRVMLVRAAAMATPATVFESDHRKVEDAIAASEPGSTALDLDQAFAFARHIQSQQGRRSGEIAFIGAGRINQRDAAVQSLPRNLRVIAIPDAIENTGLRRVAMRRSTTDANVWEIYVTAHNYGTRPRTVTVATDFGGRSAAARTPAGEQKITLDPGADQELTFQYRTVSSGMFGVTLTPHDAFPADDHAEIEIPAQPALNVTVYSDRPDSLKPVLDSTPRINVAYHKPSEYRSTDSGLVILDRFIPPVRPAADSIWIDPPAAGSPIPVRTSVSNVPFAGWDSGHPAAAGLNTKDFKLDRATVFEPAPTDGKIGEVAAGPVIVARPGNPKIVVLGFDPAFSPMRYELATPLLYANLLRWVSPEIFRRSEVSGGSVGSVKLEMDQAAAQKDIKVTAEDGSALPFTLRDKTVNFFSGEPGSVRVVAGDREYMYSLTLPELADSKWKPPANTRTGIPTFANIVDRVSDLWPWLAIAGALCLLAEWIIYGRFRRVGVRTAPLVMRSRSEVRPEVNR